MSEKGIIVTIDGPSGSGKGTVSRLLALKLGYNLLDSGALYRVLAYVADLHEVNMDNEEALAVLAEHLDVQFNLDPDIKTISVVIEGQIATDLIRSERCGENASKVAVFPKVRQALLARQQAFASAKGLVCDGRDMGTIVFPEAKFKIYLDASSEVRARRRFEQLKEKGINVNLADVQDELSKRDLRDSQRETAPLRAAEDAVIIDTSSKNIEQVLEEVLKVLDYKETL
jgi:cytidylate kinase